MKQTIEEVQSAVELGLIKLRSAESMELKPLLEALVPDGYRPRVVFFENDRKKKRNASADSWSVASGEIRISFEPYEHEDEEIQKPDVLPTSHVPVRASTDAPPATKPSEFFGPLIRALDQAEARPGYNFVALKWFRDEVLPALGSSWSEPQFCGQVLRDSIEQRIVLTSKIPNPKAPQFPVTAVRLNRLHPEVNAVVGAARGFESDFSPVEIRGEGLSATILRERR